LTSAARTISPGGDAGLPVSMGRQVRNSIHGRNESMGQGILLPDQRDDVFRRPFVQARGVLKKELLRHLRSKRSMRRSKPADPNGDRRGHIKDIVSIRQRPAAVEDRAVPGHWEGDLLSGPNNSYIATLVECHTRYVMLAKVAGKDTQTVVSALIKQAKKLPKELYKSLTWDRGKELTDHRRFTVATKIDVWSPLRQRVIPS
jgi:IS30 family transposase